MPAGRPGGGEWAQFPFSIATGGRHPGQSPNDLLAMLHPTIPFPAACGAPQRHAPRVLVVEPHQALRRQIGLALRRGGIARRGDGTSLPLIALCARATPWRRLRLFLAGARRCLVRPMRLDDFVEAVWDLHGHTTPLLTALPRGM